MWPTKANFPGRWRGSLCNICGLNDTDEHVFSCPGYGDLVIEGMSMDMFWDNDILADTEKIKVVAKCVIKIIERMEDIQGTQS